MSVQDFYLQSVSALPANEQLQLASLILTGLTRSSTAGIDVSDSWSEQDLLDFASFSAQLGDTNKAD